MVVKRYETEEQELTKLIASRSEADSPERLEYWDQIILTWLDGTLYRHREQARARALHRAWCAWAILLGLILGHVIGLVNGWA